MSGILSRMTTFSPPQGEFAHELDGPERTSVAAVLALIFGILGLVLCCIPFIGPVVAGVGLLFSVFAFIAIGRSEGRLGGNGLAVAGLACSIIGMFLGIIVAVGVAQGTAMVAKFGDSVAAAQNDDLDKVKQAMSSNAQARLTPEVLTTFKDQTIQTLGKYQRVKPGIGMWVDAVSAMMKVMPNIPQQYQAGGLSPLPLAAEFEKGDGLVILIMNESEEKIENIGVAPESGAIVWLFDPGAP